MQLAAREPSPQRLDRVRLTEDVHKRHGGVIGAAPLRGKRAGAIGLFCGLFVACASEPPRVAEAPPPPPPAMATTANTAAPLSPIELSKRALAEASSASDPHERCRLLQEAALLDPSSIDARLARAESRCAFARELLADARAAFAARHDQRSAEALASVAERSASRADQLAAAEVLAKLDLTSKLAAARIFGGERAAALFDEVASAREAKGATVDALDARLDAAMARADAGKPSGLMALVDAAAAASKSYGAEWIAPKLVEAIAAARVAGEASAAVAARAEKLGLFATPAARDAFAIERAIAEGKDVPRLHARVFDPAVRALLVATAKDCATASAHARAHRRSTTEGLVLARDVARALKKACPNGEVTTVPTVVPPALSPELADIVVVARVEPLHARARLAQLVKESPSDPAARRAIIETSSKSDALRLLDEAIAATPSEPGFHRFRVVLLEGHARAEAARQFTKNVLPTTVEARVARGLARDLGIVMRLADGDDPAWTDVAAALVSTCAVASTGACVDGADLALATNRLRRGNNPLLAEKGLLLSPEDLASHQVRLDVIVALVDRKKLAAAIKLRTAAWTGEEASLADAVITANNGHCAVAKPAMTKAAALHVTHADVFARIAKTCP